MLTFLRLHWVFLFPKKGGAEVEASFKVSIKGYDRQEVNSFVKQVMESFDMEVDRLNEKLTQLKQSNGQLKTELSKIDKAHMDDNGDGIDNNLKMDLIVVDGKLKEREKDIEKLIKERKHLEGELTHVEVDKSQEIEHTMKLLESKKVQLEEELKSLHQFKHNELENVKQQIVQKLSCVEKELNKTLSSHQVDHDQLQALNQLVEENDLLIEKLRLQRNKKAETGVEILENEKNKISEILINAYKEHDEIIEKAVEENEQRLTQKLSKVDECCEVMTFLESQLSHLKDTVRYTLSKDELKTEALELEDLSEFQKLEVL